jgi:trk system potassium uptake protein TrkH
MARQAIELSYAVRFRVIGRYFGQLCLVLAGLALVPLVVALAAGTYAIALR